MYASIYESFAVILLAGINATIIISFIVNFDYKLYRHVIKLLLSSLQLYPLPTWQSNAVNAYLKAVSGTSQQPYSSNKTIGSHAVGSFNSNG